MFFDALPSDAWIRVAVAVVVTAYLAWEDHRTSFMNETLLYGFAAAGLAWGALFFPFPVFMAAVAVAAVIGVGGYFSYKAGQFGGGDVLLLAGLALWLPSSPLIPVPVSWPFVLGVFLSASFLASVGSFLWYAGILYRQKRFPGKKAPLFLLASVVAVAAVALLPFSIPSRMFFIAVCLPAAFYLTYRKDVLEHAVIQDVPFKDILDEDVLALEKFSGSDVNKYGLERVLTKAALKKLKAFAAAKKVREVPIYRMLPRFGPYLLAGLLLGVVLGDLVWALVAG